jgi:hypothetical protein
LPHSDIRGSQLADSSPRLNAAYHVLHRLLAPRHPPYTLTSSARIASTRQAGRIGSISLIFDVIDCSMHRLFRCHHSSVVKVLARAPCTPVLGQTKTAWLLPDRSHTRRTLIPGQGPRCSPYSERVCSLDSRAAERQQLFIPYPASDCNSRTHSFQTSVRAEWPVGVGVPGLEPGTSVLSGLRSNQLS